jgi:hypothetical protein
MTGAQHPQKHRMLFPSICLHSTHRSDTLPDAPPRRAAEAGYIIDGSNHSDAAAAYCAFMDENNPITPPAEVYCNDGAMTADVTTTAPSTLDALSDPLTSACEAGVAGDHSPFRRQNWSRVAQAMLHGFDVPLAHRPTMILLLRCQSGPLLPCCPHHPPLKVLQLIVGPSLLRPYVPGTAADGNRLLLPINMRFKPVDRGRPTDIVWTLLSSSTISCTSVHDSFQQLWKDVIDAMAPNV